MPPFARVITSNLSTNFLARAGGLTNNNRFDYAKCIAANIVDYIDSDSTPSIQTGTDGYRGCEALPLVSEVAFSIQWTNQVKTGVRYEEEFEVVHVVEFWNMFNKPVQWDGELWLQIQPSNSQIWVTH